MNEYNAPLDEIKFILNDVLGLGKLLELDRFAELSPNLIGAILDEAGKFAGEKLSPLNIIGDKQGCKSHDGKTETPPGFKGVYAEFVENGWNSVAVDTQYGGQGLPFVVYTAISEMWSSANMAFALCPLLTQGSVELLTQHGSDEQRQKYLGKLVSGQWTGTMCLTESQAGSDVGAVSTKAIKNGDHYLIKGQKIFITYGEHDFTDNIIHMVLARTEDAPAGSRGISLFIVPKILENGDTNDMRAISIEHKLGIHASPTAILAFGDNEGAIGYLVGEENQGLKYMFTMMNSARLAVGVEGVAIAENSYQKAKEFAEERKQGGKAISEYPDVKRMLLNIKANTKAMRVLSYYIAKSIDISNHHADENTRKKHKGIVDLLIPVVKAHATDLGFDLSSEAMQIFGGVGYVEETGIAQNLRDSRIAMIYEGTNGIQAMDLVMRKIANVDAVNDFFEDVKSLYGDSQYCEQVDTAVEVLKSATEYMREIAINDKEKAGFVAMYYLKAFAIIVGGAMIAACDKSGDKGEDLEFYINYALPSGKLFAELASSC